MSSFSPLLFPFTLSSHRSDLSLNIWLRPTESLVRYRLLSEPELSNLLKTTLSNGSLQSANSHQPDPENASSELDSPENLINEQKLTRLLATDDNDNNSQNRNNNNLVQTWVSKVFSFIKLTEENFWKCYTHKKKERDWFACKYEWHCRRNWVSAMKVLIIANCPVLEQFTTLITNNFLRRWWKKFLMTTRGTSDRD